MENASNRRSLVLISLVGFFIITFTYLISIFARGYRFSLNNGFTLNPTGIVSTVSSPKGASVYINDKLITATDDTFNLSPGVYNLKISKNGFNPWQKTITVKPETVYQADIQLFNSVPDLKPITLTGSINPTANSDNTKIIYAVASASATKDNGLYLIEANGLPISLIRSDTRQLATSSATLNWPDFSYTFSPNSRQILATNTKTKVNYLISLDSQISSQKLTDVTKNLKDISDDWQTQTSLIISNKIERLPKEIQAFISTTSAQHIQYSTKEDKILYLAQTDGDIKENLITPPPAQSTQTQNRQIKSGNYYVYDIKDDTNFLIGHQKDISQLFWIPNTNNLIYVQDKQLKVIDYDGTNQQTILNSNFDSKYVYPWPDGNKIVILSNLSSTNNLYSLSIKK